MKTIEEGDFKNLPISNRVVDFASLLSTILGSQRTYSSLIRTISIFAALSVLIKNHWILIAVIIIFIISIYEFSRNYQQLRDLSNKFNIKINKDVLNNITNYNYTLYGFSFILVIVFLVLIYKFYKKDI